jgi:phosphoglycerol transferase MdoB-like AlkP superfamily enzyme
MWLPIAVLGLHFLLYSSARMALLMAQYDSFAPLDAGQILWAFVYGLRFDASMIFLVWGIPLTLAFFPLRIFRSSIWRGIVLALAGISLVLHAFLFLADTVYFSYVNRHIGMELVAVFSDTKLFTAMLREDYLLHLSAFAAAAAGFAYMYWRLIWRFVHGSGGNGGGWWKAFLFLVMAVVAVRGGVTNRKSVNIVHAFTSPELSAGYLTLNAPFSAYHTLRSSSAVKSRFMDDEQAQNLVRQDLGLPADRQRADYPLFRLASPESWMERNGLPGVESPAEMPNVVVIMLESWDAWYVDAWRQSQGMEPLGLTPEFDALAKEGRLYTDFYATGQRSVHGVAAILASIATLPGVPYIGTGGLEQNRLSFVSTLAKELGYHNFFIRSAGRESYRLDRVAKVGSFDFYNGAEDLLERFPDAPTHKFGVWDDLMFEVAAEYQAGLQKPYFGFLFPSSTHHPFVVPDDKWQQRSGDSREERFSDSLRYSDWTLGEYFRAVRQLPEFSNTLFIVTADHASGVRQGDIPMLHRFLLPCLIIGPGIEPAVDSRTCSQVNIAPTVVDFCGWPIGHSSMGVSMLPFVQNSYGSESQPADEKTGIAVMATEHEVLRKEGSSWVLHNLGRRLGGEGENQDEVEERLLATVQVVNQLLRANKIMPLR